MYDMRILVNNIVFTIFAERVDFRCFSHIKKKKKFYFQKGLFYQKTLGPFPCWTVCSWGRRVTSKGTGSLPGNPLQEEWEKQYRSQQGKCHRASGPTWLRVPGTAKGSCCHMIQKIIPIPREGRVVRTGRNERQAQRGREGWGTQWKWATSLKAKQGKDVTIQCFPAPQSKHVSSAQWRVCWHVSLDISLLER